MAARSEAISWLWVWVGTEARQSDGEVAELDRNGCDVIAPS